MSAGSMNAVVKSLPKRGAQFQELAIPTPGRHEVLVRVKAASICGTDLQIYEWSEWAQQHVRLAKVTGHEFGGEVVEVGAEVASLRQPHSLHLGSGTTQYRKSSTVPGKRPGRAKDNHRLQVPGPQTERAHGQVRICDR